MARSMTTFSASGTSLIAVANKPRHADAYLCSVFFYGNFGGGTLALELSPDNGTTWMPAYNMSGTAITATTATNFNMTMGCGGSNADCILIRGNLTGATTPSLNVALFDNLG